MFAGQIQGHVHASSELCLVDDGTSAIGFTSCASSSRVYGEHEIVLFERELTNYGGYYNTQTSSFICPVDVVYIFTLTINVDIADVVVCIMRNDVELTDSWAWTDNELYTQATNKVVTERLAGDVVWPRVSYSNGSGEIRSSSGYTKLSAVLTKAI